MTVIAAISLLHFLWQGALIGLVAWIAMRFARTARARYVVGVAALALMAAAPVATGAWVKNTVVPGPASLVPGSPSSQVQVPATATSNQRDSGRGTWDDVLQLVRVSPSAARWLLTSWLLGVGLLSIRLSFGWWTARRLTRLSVRESRLEVLSNAERLMAALGITAAVRVLESSLVQVPTAMGWLKPVVLLPAAAMTGLSMAQIDALVAHELAHIKRHDYLVNLFQSAIETLLFYHPAVWLISRRVRHERELCCDDLAIAACGDDRLTYASALADLELMRQVPEPMLAANGGSLLMRVRRILGQGEAAAAASRTNWMTGVAILLVALVAVPVNVVRARASAVANGEVVSAPRTQQAVAGEVTGGTVSGISGDVAANVRGGVRGGVAKAAVPMPSPDPDVDVAPPVSQQPVRVGGNIAPPERIKYVQPAYPQAAKDAHVSGIVIAEIVVDETGKVTDATLLRSIHLLDEAALDAVKQWRYRPTMLNGQAVPVIMTVTINFTLADGTVGVGAPARSQGLSVSFSAPVDEPTLWNGREVMKIGGAVKAPERIRYVAPVYPQEAQAARVTGIVIIQAVIDETGRVVATKVLRSIALLDDAAIDAVRQWEYTPTLLDGVAIPVLMTVTVNFTLQGQK